MASTTDPQIDAVSAGDADTRSLRDYASVGIAWLVGQSIISRLVTFASQVVLAWLLSPEAFGTIALAYAIMAFARVFQEGAIGKVLVVEQRCFDRYSPSGFWLSLFFGVGTALLLTVSAPLVGAVYESPVLPKLIWILAAAVPLHALRSVPAAVLTINLRYGTQTKLNALELVSQHALTVALAFYGFGVYSFVIPVVVVAPVITALFFWRSGFSPPAFTVQTWKALLFPSSQLMLAAIIASAVEYGDYLILGHYFEKNTVGLYFLAYTLSVQGVMLIVNAAGNTLFPLLSKLRTDVERQRAAFVRACSMGTIVMVPFCLFIAVHANTIIGLLYSERWVEAAPLLTILSLGMSLRFLSAAGYAALVARGDYRLILGKNIGRTLLLLILLLPAAQASLGLAAVAVAVVYAAEALAVFVLVAGFERQHLRALAEVVVPPVVAGGVAGGVSILLPRALLAPWQIDSALLNIGSSWVVFVALYYVATRVLIPLRIRELISFAARFRPSQAVSPIS